ncbi:hypothetical protein Q669_25470 [Labrenzia sp. C1B10]|nr:hypothetical protein Q669_25470 [Labrenzia sp. C1B10]ERS08986.1 hypothetical protein Q675_16385 [Labrenzia sp. C1B70]
MLTVLSARFEQNLASMCRLHVEFAKLTMLVTIWEEISAKNGRSVKCQWTDVLQAKFHPPI